MICSGRACGKKLEGGFKQEDGTFRCAACVVNEVEMETTLSGVKRAMEILIPTMKTPNKRFKKHTVGLALRELKAIVSIREQLK